MSSYDFESDVAFSGLYNLLLTIGFTSTSEVYKLTILFQILALVMSLIGLTHSVFIDSLVFYLLSSIELPKSRLVLVTSILPVHGNYKLHPLRLLLAVHDLSHLRLNFYTKPLVGFTSILWSGHLIHKAIPVSRGFILDNIHDLRS